MNIISVTMMLDSEKLLLFQVDTTTVFKQWGCNQLAYCIISCGTITDEGK